MILHMLHSLHVQVGKGRLVWPFETTASNQAPVPTSEPLCISSSALCHFSFKSSMSALIISWILFHLLSRLLSYISCLSPGTSPTVRAMLVLVILLTSTGQSILALPWLKPQETDSQEWGPQAQGWPALCLFCQWKARGRGGCRGRNGAFPLPWATVLAGADPRTAPWGPLCVSLPSSDQEDKSSFVGFLAFPPVRVCSVLRVECWRSSCLPWLLTSAERELLSIISLSHDFISLSECVSACISINLSIYFCLILSLSPTNSHHLRSKMNICDFHSHLLNCNYSPEVPLWHVFSIQGHYLRFPSS